MTSITPTNPIVQAVSRRSPTDSFKKNFPMSSKINGSIKTIATASAIGIDFIAKKKQLENLKKSVEKRTEQFESLDDKLDKVIEVVGEVEQIITPAGTRG